MVELLAKQVANSNKRIEQLEKKDHEETKKRERKTQDMAIL